MQEIFGCLFNNYCCFFFFFFWLSLEKEQNAGWVSKGSAFQEMELPDYASGLTIRDPTASWRTTAGRQDVLQMWLRSLTKCPAKCREWECSRRHPHALDPCFLSRKMYLSISIIRLFQSGSRQRGSCGPTYLTLFSIPFVWDICAKRFSGVDSGPGIDALTVRCRHSGCGGHHSKHHIWGRGSRFPTVCSF